MTESTSIEESKDKRNPHHSIRKKRLSQLKIYSSSFIYSILEKSKLSRTKIEIRILTEYLSSKFEYFKKLRTQDALKCEKLVSVLNIESFKENTPIINYGEEGDKFYIVLDGTVGVYKPIYIEKIMTVNQYYSYMTNIKFQENNYLKLRRITEKNSHFNFDLDALEKLDQDSYFMRKKLKFYIEENDKLGEFGCNFAFGEIALIKRTKRNATIIALQPSKLISIDKYDYNKIIRELEEKRLEKVLEEFKRNYPLFQYWTLNHLIRLLNCFSHLTITQGEYLYRQNDTSDHIYIIRSGTFEMYSLLSFGWLNDYYAYIRHAKENLIYLLETNKVTKESDLHDLIGRAQREAPCSPVKYNKHRVNSITTSIDKNENVFTIKAEEEALNSPFSLFKVKIRNIDYKDVVGIEDAIEMKNRFCFVKCVSSHAEVDRVNLIDFVKLMNMSTDMKNRNVLLEIIAEKKAWLLKMIKNGVKNQAGYFGRKFNIRYNNLLKEPNECKSQNSKTIFNVNNNIVNVKLRAWGSEIDEIAGRNCLTQRSSRTNLIESKIISPKKTLRSIKTFFSPQIKAKTKSMVVTQKCDKTLLGSYTERSRRAANISQLGLSTTKQKTRTICNTLIASKRFFLRSDFNKTIIKEILK